MSWPTKTNQPSACAEVADGLGTSASRLSPTPLTPLGQRMKSGSASDCSSAHTVAIASRYGPP